MKTTKTPRIAHLALLRRYAAAIVMDRHTRCFDRDYEAPWPDLPSSIQNARIEAEVQMLCGTAAGEATLRGAMASALGCSASGLALYLDQELNRDDAQEDLFQNALTDEEMDGIHEHIGVLRLHALVAVVWRDRPPRRPPKLPVWAKRPFTDYFLGAPPDAVVCRRHRFRAEFGGFCPTCTLLLYQDLDFQLQRRVEALSALAYDAERIHAGHRSDEDYAALAASLATARGVEK